MSNIEPPDGQKLRDRFIGRLLAAAAILFIAALVGGLALWILELPALR